MIYNILLKNIDQFKQLSIIAKKVKLEKMQTKLSIRHKGNT